MKVGTRPYEQRVRARQAEQTAERILAAVLELFPTTPYAQLTLAAVADRAGVSVQTVIRRFGDKESLVRTAAAEARDRVASQRGSAPAGDLDGIVDNLVEHYLDMGEVSLRLLAEASTSPAIAEISAEGTRLHQRWCERAFAPWLPAPGPARRIRLAQVVAVCDVRTWEILRHRQGLSVVQTRAALRELLRPLLS